MKAAEARILAKSQVPFDKKRIYDLIETAAKAGKTGIRYYRNISPETLQSLQIDGYKLTDLSDPIRMDGPGWGINW